jgi:hypothetical protein
MRIMMKARTLSSAIASLLLAPMAAAAQDVARTPTELDRLIVTGERDIEPPLALLPCRY